ncbi:MAG: hypothetical protein A4E53_01172 [Pelotomaculum sp. PtaB.Bin104]|nr:MAG: hypothetical protein A4E53_01172 [Pelotomaculum sp. PtaB.Bin104]
MKADSVKIINDKICLTSPALANILGIDRRTIQGWSESGCPKEARGWWSIKDVLAWRGLVNPGGLKTEDQVEETSLNHKKLKYEAELKKQKAEAAAFENAIARGDYIPKAEVTNELKRFFVVLKRSMLGYSRRIATEVSPYVDSTIARRIEKMITDLTLDALQQLSIDGVYRAPKNKRKDGTHYD